MGGSHRDTYPVYSHAPIAEAVIDLRAEFPGGVALPTLARAQRAEQGKYPKRMDRLESQALFGPESRASDGSKITGYVCSSRDGREIFQTRVDGFAFSRLAPYERWDTFRDEARRLWRVYRAITKPKRVTRVAVRYINRLDIPLPVRSFGDYLRTLPEVSPDLPQGVSSYFMQIQIPQEDLGALLMLTEAIVPPKKPDVISIVLDIDLFRERDIPEDEQRMWDCFEQLRDRKNAIFEACIADAVRELIR